MEPELQSSQFQRPESQEINPSQAPSAEVPQGTFQGVERSAEHFEQRSELQASASDAVSSALPQIAVPPVDDQQAYQSSPQQSSVTDSTNPIIAADEDLIEKEWVDKAKKIVLSTKDDPYLREQEVSKLQADYIEKRYGRRIGQAGE